MAGNQTLTATYTGGPFHAPSVASTTHQVNKANTSILITQDTPEPSVPGQDVTVRFSVAALSPGGGVPVGTVVVSAPDAAACVSTLSGGSGVCNLAFTAAGVKTITGSYQGNANYFAAQGYAPHAVNKADTTTVITKDSPDPSYVGQAFDAFYTVTVNPPGGGVPTGNVSTIAGGTQCDKYYDGTPDYCYGTIWLAGSHVITATYAGNDSYNGSVVYEPHTVLQNNSFVTIISHDPNPSPVGGAVTVNMSFVPPIYATGDITVSGPDTTGCVAVRTGGSASCTLVFTAVGEKTLTATYAGDANWKASSDTVSHTVIAAATPTRTATAAGTQTRTPTATATTAGTQTPTVTRTGTRTSTPTVTRTASPVGSRSPLTRRVVLPVIIAAYTP